MRLKHVKGAETRILNSNYLIKDYNDYKGKYKCLFNNNNEIHIEIGMGKGNFIINKALNNRNINFIGIEKYDSVIVKCIEKIDKLDIPNLRLIRMDANKILDVFYKEIDCIYLNFSDPWPKNRHEHRRLTSTNFLVKYDKLFKNNKRIVMKTDNRGLFEYSIISLINYGYKIEKISLDLHNSLISDNIETEYEMKFSKKGYPIYMINVYKNE